MAVATAEYFAREMLLQTPKFGTRYLLIRENGVHFIKLQQSELRNYERGYS